MTVKILPTILEVLDLRLIFKLNLLLTAGLLLVKVDVIPGNYQTVHGFWAAKLNGQFASGSISQSFAITTPNLQCNAAYYSATNIRAPTGFQANYSMIVSMGSTKIATLNFLGNPNDPTNPRLFTVNTPFVTLGATGTYTLSFVSNDNTPVTFTDGLFPTMTYYGRTGIVIDDICFSCLASPSPSVSPTPSAAPSTSPTSVPSQSNSPSSSPAPSVLPAPSCPAFIEDDDNWEFVPHRNDDEDSQDTTTVNVYFADILNRGRHY